MERVLGARPGVVEVDANPVAQTATVELPPGGDISRRAQEVVEKCGYHCAGRSVPGHVCEPLAHEGADAPAHDHAATERAEHAHGHGHGGHAGMSMGRGSWRASLVSPLNAWRRPREPDELPEPAEEPSGVADPDPPVSSLNHAGARQVRASPVPSDGPPARSSPDERPDPVTTDRNRAPAQAATDRAGLCRATNRKGEPCRKKALRDGLCLVHSGDQDMRELGREGGRRSRRRSAVSRTVSGNPCGTSCGQPARTARRGGASRRPAWSHSFVLASPDWIASHTFAGSACRRRRRGRARSSR